MRRPVTAPAHVSRHTWLFYSALCIFLGAAWPPQDPRGVAHGFRSRRGVPAVIRSAGGWTTSARRPGAARARAPRARVSAGALGAARGRRLPRRGHRRGMAASAATSAADGVHARTRAQRPELDLGYHFVLGSKSIGFYGQRQQKRRLEMAAGRLRTAISFTEPGGGTDVLGAMRTTARRVDGGWAIDGERLGAPRRTRRTTCCCSHAATRT